MLFCLSFTQSERFLQTGHQTSICCRDKLLSHVDEKRVREHVRVRCSDLVGSDPLHPLIDVRQIAASVIVPELCDEPLEDL